MFLPVRGLAPILPQTLSDVTEHNRVSPASIQTCAKVWAEKLCPKNPKNGTTDSIVQWNHVIMKKKLNVVFVCVYERVYK